MSETRPAMRRSTRGLLLLLAILPLTVLLFTVLYMLGETYLEHQPRDFWTSLEWAAETLTTTGYGADAHWNHPLMVILVVLAQFSGLFLIFLILPIYVIPYFEERFEARLPEALPKGKDLVLIIHFSPAVAALVEDLRRLERRFAVLEQDRGAARDVQHRGLPVVHINLRESTLPDEDLERVSAVVANDTDQDNVALIMMFRDSGYGGPILAFAETPLHRVPMQRLGATNVYTPKHLLAAALATRASRWITTRVRDVQELGENVGVHKLRIPQGSSLAGQTLRQAGLWKCGVSVIGIWSGGRFIAIPPPDTILNVGSVIVTIGSHEALAELGERVRPLTRNGPFLVCGYGEVGRRVTEMLRDAGESVVVVNDVADEGVDIVGNVLNPNVLESMDRLEPKAIVLAIGNDTETQFLAAVVRDSMPDVPLIARVNQSQSVDRLHRLGVDFALSVDSVAGELLATQLLGEEYVEVDPELRVSRVLANGLVGQNPWKADLAERFGCKVVALVRDGNVLVSFDEDFTVQPSDQLFLCGSPEAVDAYLEAYPEARPARPIEAGPQPASVT